MEVSLWNILLMWYTSEIECLELVAEEFNKYSNDLTSLSSVNQLTRSRLISDSAPDAKTLLLLQLRKNTIPIFSNNYKIYFPLFFGILVINVWLVRTSICFILSTITMFLSSCECLLRSSWGPFRARCYIMCGPGVCPSTPTYLT